MNFIGALIPSQVNNRIFSLMIMLLAWYFYLFRNHCILYRLYLRVVYYTVLYFIYKSLDFTLKRFSLLKFSFNIQFHSFLITCGNSECHTLQSNWNHLIQQKKRFDSFLFLYSVNSHSLCCYATIDRKKIESDNRKVHYAYGFSR